MNWTTLKTIYRSVLKCKYTITYSSDDKYAITEYHDNGNKYRTIEYKDGLLHGFNTGWRENGDLWWAVRFKNGHQASIYKSWWD